ncbi:hypothetical protein [Helicobacter typhlonius]|uniref:hypothetical protein n=1 Tax=Helicobacter typhlonius TaxID=76936 RepID=UPI002FE3293E
MQKDFNTQLDNELSKLKAIGLKELSKNTKLASTKIEDVLEKRFNKIDKVRAKGFIAILEREYDVDLRDWIMLWEESQKDNVKSVSQVISKQDEEERVQRLVENVAKVKQKEKEKEQQKKEEKSREHQVLNLALKSESATKTDSESYTWFYMILVIILLALMGYFAYKAFVKDYKDNEVKPSVATTTQTSNEGEDGYDGIFFDPTKTQESETDSQGEIESTPEHTIGDELKPQAEESNVEQNFFFGNSQVTQNDNVQSTQDLKSTQNAPITHFTQTQLVKDNILHITSNYDLWLGVINLETGTKEQFSYKKEYDIKLTHRMLFVMGHSTFNLTLNGEEISHSTKYPVRMYYDGESLKDVNYTTFKQLNGGLEW